jgi:hypothetical protein
VLEHSPCPIWVALGDRIRNHPGLSWKAVNVRAHRRSR